MTEQEIARIPEEYRVEIKVGDTTTTLDVRDILSLQIEKRVEPESVYLNIKAKCQIPEFRDYKDVFHLIRTSGNNALDALVGILEKVDALNWDEKKECLHLLIRSNQ